MLLELTREEILRYSRHLLIPEVGLAGQRKLKNSSIRDMALVVDDTLAVQLPIDFVADQHLPLLEMVEGFDLYRNPQLGPGKKSVGYRLVYRAPDRSLTDEEVNVIHADLVQKVLRRFRAVLR